MKIKFLLSLVIMALAFAGLSCTDDNGVAYNNLNDPFSSIYQPQAPSSLTATVLADSGIMLSWKSNSLKEDGFRIFSRKGIIGDLVKIAQVPAKTTTYFDRFQVHSGVTYYYQVASFNKNIRGNYSKEINVKR
ncbi:MAG TPA: fibronectin type III domain-containing protein [Ignavibacteriales bacterium]|nr:fibronectin type III domain-containing protein [Ignavibacteriales bacterium]